MDALHLKATIHEADLLWEFAKFGFWTHLFGIFCSSVTSMRDFQNQNWQNTT
jgi:hypothetical protein